MKKKFTNFIILQNSSILLAKVFFIFGVLLMQNLGSTPLFIIGPILVILGVCCNVISLILCFFVIYQIFRKKGIRWFTKLFVFLLVIIEVASMSTIIPYFEKTSFSIELTHVVNFATIILLVIIRIIIQKYFIKENKQKLGKYND